MTTLRSWTLVTLAAAGCLAAPVPAQAGGSIHVGVTLGHRPSYDRHEAYRIGRERGERDGFRAGYQDGRRARRFDYEDGRYRDGDAGYRRGYGPRHVYVSGYRNGYESTYRRGYREGREQRHDGRHDGRYDRYDRH